MRSGIDRIHITTVSYFSPSFLGRLRPVPEMSHDTTLIRVTPLYKAKSMKRLKLLTHLICLIVTAGNVSYYGFPFWEDNPPSHAQSDWYSLNMKSYPKQLSRSSIGCDKMKVFISVDLEGISGVVHTDEILNAHAHAIRYQEARRWMTMDVNAAVEGALEGGATEVVVRDAHWHKLNIIYGKLHRKAHLIRGYRGPLTVLDGIDKTFNAVYLVGYHARMGDGLGVLSHTWDSRVFFDVKLNGESVSEAKIAAAQAGHYGIPVVLVTGDDVICREVQSWLKGVEVAIVKEAMGRMGAKCLSQKEAHALIKEKASFALQRTKEVKPYTYSSAITLQVVCIHPGIAQKISIMPGVNYDGKLAVSYTGSDFMKIQRAFMTMYVLGSSAVSGF